MLVPFATMNIAALQLMSFLPPSTLDALLYFQTITLPRSNIGDGYYFRKLNVYNLTVSELGAADDWCYTWDESELLKGSNEISLCLYRFLQEKDSQGIVEIDLFSDSCSGQQKNKFFCTMLIYFLLKSQNMKTITHRVGI